MRASIAAVVVAAALTVGSASASTEADARLALVSDRPAVVVGTGFRPGERVVLLIAPGPSARTVRAGALGRFRVALRISVPRCGGIVVQALGSRGSRAMVDRTGLDCAPVD